MKPSNFPNRIEGQKKKYKPEVAVYKLRKLRKSPIEIERITGLDLSYILQITEIQEENERKIHVKR